VVVGIEASGAMQWFLQLIVKGGMKGDHWGGGKGSQ